MPSREKIRSRRMALGLSMVALARLLRLHGLTTIDDSDISRIESGKKRLLADEVPFFAAALDCEISDLMDEKPARKL